MRLRVTDSNMIKVLWWILLFMILCMPRTWQAPKIILCVLLIGVGLFKKKNLTIGKTTFKFLGFWLLYCILTLIMGLIYNNPDEGLIAFVRLNLIDVALYILVLSTIMTEKIVPCTIEAMVFSTFYISLYNIILVAMSYLGMDLGPLQYLDATARIGIHQGYSHVVTTNLSMTIILFPMILSINNHEFVRNHYKRWFYTLTIILCATAMILSGRRILWVVLAISAIVYYLRNAMNPTVALRAIGVVCLMLFVLYFLIQRNVISISGLVNRFNSAFANVDEYGVQNKRLYQGAALIEGFEKHPIFGNGAGAVLGGYSSDYSSDSWTFELSYHSVLFQSGLIGIILYFTALLEIFIGIIRKFNDDKIMRFGLILLYVCALISNATNPYFSSSFDFLIFIFLSMLLADSYTGYMDSYDFQDKTDVTFNRQKNLDGGFS